MLIFLVRPYLHALAELPGSTPDDIGPRNDHDPMISSFYKRRSTLQGEDPRSSDQVSFRATVANQNAAFESLSDTHRTGDNDLTTHEQQSLDLLPNRRSFDDMRPSISSLDQRARASFDMARPRSNSEQVRTQRSSEVRYRASSDQVRPMPTLTERPIERFNSTASIALGDAVSVPISSMRHRLKPVTVRKPLLKTGSHSSGLPLFPSQTSLMDDLSTWVIPQSARDDYCDHESNQSVGTAASFTTSTPATSVTSSPIVSKSTPGWTPALITATSTVSTTVPTETADLSDNQKSAEVSSVLIPALPSRPAPPPPIPAKIPLDVPPQPEAIEQTHGYLQRSDSATIPPPLSRRRRPVRASKRALAEKESPQSIPSAASWPPTANLADSTSLDSDVPGKIETYQNLPNDGSSSISPQVHRNALHHLTSSASATDKYPIAYTPSDFYSPPDLSTPPVEPSDEVMASTDVDINTFPAPPVTSARETGSKNIRPMASTSTSTLHVQTSSGATSVETLATEAASASNTSRPMTAMARRRAAQAKRMQMAFGGESGDM